MMVEYYVIQQKIDESFSDVQYPVQSAELLEDLKKNWPTTEFRVVLRKYEERVLKEIGE